MDKLTIQIDPDLTDLIPAFLAHKRDDIAGILSATGTESIDFDELGRLGHRLKGEGGSYGFDFITSYGSLIEQAAAKRDGPAIRGYATELANYLNSVEIVYE